MVAVVLGRRVKRVTGQAVETRQASGHVFRNGVNPFGFAQAGRVGLQNNPAGLAVFVREADDVRGVPCRS